MPIRYPGNFKTSVRNQRSNEAWRQYGIGMPIEYGHASGKVGGWDPNSQFSSDAARQEWINKARAAIGTNPSLLPNADIAPDVQHFVNINTRERNDKLLADALERGRGLFSQGRTALRSGINNMRSYRPGGVAAMNSGYYGRLADSYERQADLDLRGSSARRTEPLDVMFRYDEKRRKAAEKQAKRAGLTQLVSGAIGAIGGVASSALGVAGGGVHASSMQQGAGGAGSTFGTGAGVNAGNALESGQGTGGGFFPLTAGGGGEGGGGAGGPSPQSGGGGSPNIPPLPGVLRSQAGGGGGGAGAGPSGGVTQQQGGGGPGGGGGGAGAPGPNNQMQGGVGGGAGGVAAAPVTDAPPRVVSLASNAGLTPDAMEGLLLALDDEPRESTFEIMLDRLDDILVMDRREQLALTGV